MLHLTTVDADTYNLLQALFAIDIIKENFALAGGTSLALQTGHRKSIDLDFFCPRQFDVKELEVILSSQNNFTFSYTGNNSRMLFAFINDIKCDFVHEPAELLLPFEMIDSIAYYTLRDIAAMKLHTICGRGKKKDFFDVYVLLKLFGWDTLIEWFVKKYGENQLLFLWRSIIYFVDAENDPDIEGLVPYNQSWKQIKEFIIATCAS